MSSLRPLLLFYKAGYIVAKYISMEMLIEKAKETYYEALQASSTRWHDMEAIDYRHNAWKVIGAFSRGVGCQRLYRILDEVQVP